MSNLGSLNVEVNPSIVLNPGSFNFKAGFAGETTPKSSFLSVVSVGRGIETKVGQKVFEGGQRCQIPIEKGLISIFYGFERICEYTFNELNVNPQERCLLLTESPLNTNEKREKTIESIVETFLSPFFYLAEQSTLSLYASGRTTGVVLDLGHDVSNVVPIHEGEVIQKSIKSVELAGNVLTKHFCDLLGNKGYSFITRTERDIVRDMKETLGLVSLDYKRDLLKNEEQTYILPDGNEITLDYEVFQCAEPLFQPELLYGSQITKGIHELLFKTIQEIEGPIQKKIFENIVLSGGTSMFRVLNERMEKEIGRLAQRFDVESKIIIESPKNRFDASWIGGSMLSSLSTFKDFCNSRENVEEFGIDFVLKSLEGLHLLIKRKIDTGNEKIKMISNIHFIFK